MEAITAKTRTVLGKAVKTLRKQGVVPAVVYSKGKPAESISVNFAEFLKLWRKAGESSIVTLEMEGGAKKNVLIHDVAVDPIKNMPTHVDFYLVDMSQKVEVSVPLEFSGEEVAAKASAGMVVKIMHEVKVEALPKDLPHSLAVDVSGLAAVGDSFTVKDIVIPEGVTLHANPDDAVVIIEALHAEPETPVGPQSIEDIEVIGKKKEGEAAEEGAEAASEPSAS